MVDINVVEIQPQLVAGMRKPGKYEEMAVMIPKVCQYVAGKGVQIIGAPIFVCHEATAEESKKANEEGSADIEIAVPVSTKIDETDEIKCYELPGGTMTKIVHKGPYQDCGPAYEALMAWVQENGKKIVGPFREIYLNDPNEVPPEELLTEIYAPIE